MSYPQTGIQSLTPQFPKPYNTDVADESGVFYKLAKTISPEERSGLLERLSARVGEASEPLLPMGSEIETAETVEEHYDRMGLFRKIVLFFKSMFSHREIHDLVEDEMIDAIARTISQSHPDVFQNRTGTLGVGFFSSFDALRTKIQVLIEPLRKAFSGDRREFVAFLGTALLPLEHDRLAHASDPAELSEEDRTDEFELKKRIQIATRDALTEINKESKAHMYAMYRALYFLHELVSLSIVRTGIGEAGEVAGIAAARYRKNLSELCDVLSSLGVKPSKTSIEAVLLYQLGDVAAQDDDFEEKYKSDVANANAAIQELQNFCNRVPLTDVLKVLNRNPSYAPDALGGGEDWFSHYRQFWEETADQKLYSFLFGKRLDEFRTEASALVGRDFRQRLTRYHNRTKPSVFHAKFAETAAYLLQVSEVLFIQKLSPIFKTFLVDGEFYKNQNRDELTDAINGLSELNLKIRSVDGMLDPNADVGRSLAQLESEQLQKDIRQKRVVELISRVDTAMEDTVRIAISYLDSLTNVIKGILFGQSGGAYDTLVNIQFIGGTENKTYMAQLESAYGEMGKSKDLLYQIFDIEKSLT